MPTVQFFSSAHPSWGCATPIWRTRETNGGRNDVDLGLESTHEDSQEGVFFSPAAGQDAPYRVVEARRWFTLFFIPVIPLKVLGTFVECQMTKATYDPGILDNPTNAEFMDQLTAAVREVVTAVAHADGTVTGEERRIAVEVIGEYVEGYSEDDLDEDLGRSDAAPLDDRLSYLAGALNESGKEKLLTAAATMVTADGVIDDRDREAVRSIGEKLTMSPAHVRGVIDTAASMIAGYSSAAHTAGIAVGSTYVDSTGGL